MKRFAAVLAVLLVAGMVGIAMADEAAAVVVKGKLEVVKADDGTVAKVTVTAEDGAVVVVKAGDMQAKLVELAGQMVAVKGVVTKDGDANILTAQGFEKVEQK
ncbi:MAG: hypothetical protein A2498_15885 [Lentisphaerae bacterium RIFOXYC12_FULL_60_16]|nr:MAG: hypothetical protein A2498_15885 [Lentisphaerae bacterium RIFOXYC12_FULL_60_16]OGV73918.1 MAG: hypothetical protein A2269_04180 [Lentisphaerae bacterium RIFOXYA12_FULL_60_10]OGV79144.1 MAG: hypothetical protein A2340_03405 [Lentisphaerae bacterium RIFOXYB12_FULL_60_10]